MADIPWDELATVVQWRNCDPHIVLQGKLMAVARRLGEGGFPLNDLRVSLPDRRVAPNMYEGNALRDLIAITRAFD